MSPLSVYVLPSSPSFIRADRFSLTNSEEELVPFFDILRCILHPIQSIPQLIDQLDTIAVTLNGRSASSYDGLAHFLQSDWGFDRFASETYPHLIKLALEMPELFLEGSLPVLQAQATNVFSRRQIACLVIHQFLCTLPAPPWMVTGGGIPDFSIWYPNLEDQPHPLAVHAYLVSLFTYFERICHEDGFLDREQPISFSMHTSKTEAGSRVSGNDDARTPFVPCQLQIIPLASNDPSYLGLLGGASVISCNKQVGFGRTGTQEEVHVGTTPEACPLVLMTPPLKDAQAVVVRGAESMAAISGFGREARLERILKADPQVDWWNRTMLFMDALELDSYDDQATIPDVLPGNIDRELRKAYTGFSNKSRPYTIIYTGLWGCGSFRGNASVKTFLQWVAASYAGTPIVIICQPERRDFIEDFQGLILAVENCNLTVEQVLHSLVSIQPSSDTIKQPLRLALDNIQPQRT